MLNNLPHNIIRYLVEELPPYTGVLIFKTNEDGLITDFHGPWKDYFKKKPVINKNIHEIIPALFSMIPPLISPMILNHIQLLPNNYTDIHIIEGEDDNYWVFIVNQSRAVSGIKEFIQKINENKLKEHSISGKTKPNNSLIFNVFDFLSLKIESDDKAIITEEKPNWFNLLKQQSDNIIDYRDVFPYLEVFMIEAEEFFSKNIPGKLKSGIWTESFENGEEITLVAYAVSINSSKMLLIRPADDEINNEHLALQMAREQKLAYEKLQKAEQKLKTLLDYKDKFVSIVSHDLRSPVAAVLGISEMLINDSSEINKLSEFYREMLFSVKDEMTRLLDYNDKLYHWSNLELGNFSIEKEKIDLEKLIKTAYTTAHKKLKDKNISFSTNIQKGITITADPTLMSQVLNNLISNAIKFTPDNGMISVNMFKNNGLELSVSDTGVGMTKEISENIFADFARKSSSGTKGEKGTGLGIGIVKKIIDAHNFKIDVKSVLGEGSEFIIHIPS